MKEISLGGILIYRENKEGRGEKELFSYLVLIWVLLWVIDVEGLGKFWGDKCFSVKLL